MTYLAIEQALNDRWPKVEFRRVARIRREKNSRSIETLLALSAYTGVRPRPEDGGNQLPSDETITGYWVARPGDLVVNPMWALEGGVAVSEYRGALSTAYRVYDLGPAIAPRFAHYYFRSRPAIEQYRLMVRGLTTFDRSVSREDFEAMPMPLPPFDVQQAIADYLDSESQRIDALISKKRRMVSLMDEWFSASIGLLLQTSGDKDVPIKRLVSKIGSGATPRGGSEVYVEKEEGIAFLRSQNVRKGLVDHADIVYITREADRDLLRTRLQKGDVLLNITGGSIGRTAVVSDEDLPANVSQHVCILRPLLDVDPYLLQAALETTGVQDQIDLCQVGGNREGLNFDQVGSLRVKIPRGDDGLGTLGRLDALRKRRDALCIALTRQIELLQERRQALITAAVTGQLDISEVAA